MKSKAIFLIPFSMIILSIFIICIIISLIISAFFGKKVDEKKVINMFYENEIYFENSFSELQNDKINFNKEKTGIYVSTLGNNGIFKFVIVQDGNFNEYEDTINLISRLDLSSVLKEQGNAEYITNSIVHFCQGIVYLTDRDIYENNHPITKLVHIKDNWYYVEEEWHLYRLKRVMTSPDSKVIFELNKIQNQNNSKKKMITFITL